MMFGMFYMSIRGQVIMPETTDAGIESFPHALLKLFTGGNIGKMLVDVKAKADKEKTQ